MGTPFQHHGRSSAGIDCVGLLVMVARALGFEERDDLSYPVDRPRGFRGSTLLDRVALSCDRVLLVEFEPGDVLLFALRSGHPWHAGICVPHPLGGSAMIHTRSDLGSVKMHAIDGRWARMLHSAWRYKGIA